MAQACASCAAVLLLCCLIILKPLAAQADPTAGPTVLSEDARAAIVERAIHTRDALPRADDLSDEDFELLTGALYDAAWQLRQAKELGRAEHVFLRLVELAPAHVPALYALGDLCQRTERPDCAMQRALEIIRLEPDNKHAYRLYAYASTPTELKARALVDYLGLLDPASEAQQVVFARYDLAVTLLTLGNAENAEQILAQVVESNQKFYVARFQHALALMALGRLADAKAALAALLAVRPAHAAAQALLYQLDAANAPPLVPAAMGPNHYAGWRLPAAGYEFEPHDLRQARGHFWSECVSARRPAVFSDALEALGWQAVSRWDSAYLRAAVANVSVQAQLAIAPLSGVFGLGSLQRTVGFHDVLAAMDAAAAEAAAATGSGEAVVSAAPRLYLNTQQRGGSLVPPMLQPLASDFPLPLDLVPADRILQLNVWLGAGPANAQMNSSLHLDLTDNLYVLVRGRKRFRIASPADIGSLYLLGGVREVSAGGAPVLAPASPLAEPPLLHFSHVSNAYAIDAMRFPLAADVRFADIELEAGQALYLPAGWLHQVASTGDSLALNLWWDGVRAPSAPAEAKREL